MTSVQTLVLIDRPFIVLAETKPSKRHIPVWARYSPDDDAFQLFLQKQKIALESYTLWVLSTTRRNTNTCDDAITLTLTVQR